MSVVGLLQDEVDPLLNVMKVDKAPLESYADIGGLENQIQEIKVKHLKIHFFCKIVLLKYFFFFY